MQQKASITLKGSNGMLPAEYLPQGYFKTVIFHQSFTAGSMFEADGMGGLFHEGANIKKSSKTVDVS